LALDLLRQLPESGRVEQVGQTVSDPQPGSRAVVQDGGTIQLHAYGTPDGPPTIVLLAPLTALRLAAELLAAGLRHLLAERNHQIGVRRGPP
jgi:hypothetical protein